jgi:hypothetical protein
MDRRKFIAAMGSLAAGGAAATGTGAFTTASADRQMEVRVASDSNGYIGLFDTDSPYSSVNNGQITLDFSEVEGRGEGAGIGTFDDGKGLNPDSEYHFDDVFRIVEREYGGELRVAVTTSGFNLENLEITSNNGKSLLAEDYDDAGNAPDVSADGGSLTANVTIETKDSTDMDAGGTLTIHAGAGGTQDGDNSFTEVFE